MSRRDISNTQDIIDSRDIVARVEELENDLSTVECETCNGEGSVEGDNGDTASTITCPHCEGNQTVSLLAGVEMPEEATHEEQFKELEILRALVEEINNNAGDNADDGVTLVSDSYFEDHARQEAEDCGLLKDTDRWPGNCIDWKEAADQLKQDYSAIDWDGVEYWVRC